MDRKYQIVLKTMGNYLILFKASKNIEDIPYTERFSLVKEDGLYMVPFLGYPIEYCTAENVLSSQSGHETYKYRTKCGDLIDSEKAEYFRVSKDNRQLYKYAEKKDLFPANYFEGRWFLSQGLIETPKREGHFSLSNAYLVELDKQSNSFKVRNVSGDLETRNQEIVQAAIPKLKWVQYRNGPKRLKYLNNLEKERVNFLTIPPAGLI